MFAILAEDESDAESLSHLVKRRFENPGMSIRRKGYDGCGGLCRKGARDIKAWTTQGVKHFVICHDADNNNPSAVRTKVLESVVKPSGAKDSCCIVVPVQEIEAWMIADEAAISIVIPTFKFKGHSNPERLNSPKEWLVKQSHAANGKPLYVPAAFNPVVAQQLRFDIVAKKCPSFRSFLECLDMRRSTS